METMWQTVAGLPDLWVPLLQLDQHKLESCLLEVGSHCSLGVQCNWSGPEYIVDCSVQVGIIH